LNFKQFPLFSYDEMALIDLPAFVNHVTSYTESQKIFYIGYSNGARSLMFSAGSGENDIVSKVRKTFVIFGVLQKFYFKYQKLE